MKIEAIKDAADMAETFPGSGQLNWGEVGFNVLQWWVVRNPFSSMGNQTRSFDVESVKGMFESWWQAECKKGGAK